LFVEYISLNFELYDPLQLFEFIFRFYGWFHSMKAQRDRLSMDFYQIQASLQELSSKMPVHGPTQRSGFNGSSKNAGSSRQCAPTRSFPALNRASLALIKSKGYILSPELKQWSWRRNIAKADIYGRKVAMKIVGPKEQDILSDLQRHDAFKNHVVHLIDVIGVTDDVIVIVMPWLSPLGDNFSDPSVKISLATQFLRGVGFLHRHGFAHLDLKPGNILIEYVDGLVPHLSIIDFGVSVRVQDEATKVMGFRGTPGWTAPEVGTEDEREMTYSAIRADRWSCGRMLEHFDVDSNSVSFHNVRQKLLHPDPRRRPSLDDVLRMVAAEISHDNGKRSIEKDPGLLPKQARNGMLNLGEGLYVRLFSVICTASRYYHSASHMLAMGIVEDNTVIVH
jgi:serine/threonine protein kinase